MAGMLAAVHGQCGLSSRPRSGATHYPAGSQIAGGVIQCLALPFPFGGDLSDGPALRHGLSLRKRDAVLRGRHPDAALTRQPVALIPVLTFVQLPRCRSREHI